MSASKENKNAHLTEKQRAEQRKAEESKRKGILYTAIGVVVAVAVAALLIWDSGVFQRNTVAATIGGEEFTVADVDYYYHQTMNNFISQVTTFQNQYGIDMGYDTDKSPAEQTYSTDSETGEVTTYKDYFLESALDSMKEVVALNQAAKAAGHTLSEEAQASLDSQNQQLDQMAAQYGVTRDVMLRSLFGSYATEKVLARNLEMTILADDYLTAYEDSVDTSESALLAYYEENRDLLDSYDYRYAYINGQPETQEDEEGNTIEATEEETAAALADAKSRAEAMVAAVKGGQDFDTIAQDYVSESSKEAYSAKDYTLRSSVTGSSLSSVFQEWMSSDERQSGDVDFFENGSAYVVVQFLSRERDDTATVDVRHILVKPESEDETTSEYTDEAWAAAESKAQDILKEYLAGETTAEAFGELAETYSEDGRGSDGALSSSGGLYTEVKPGDMVETFNDWIFDENRTVGETGLVKTPYGWHIMYFQGQGRPDWQNTAKTTLVNEAAEDYLSELTEACEVVEGSGLSQVG